MKLGVLADIHGNFRALEAVTAHLERWQPDQVVVAGDIINRGPRSLDCLRFVQNKQRTDGWLTIRGNHEDYVISQAQPDTPHSGPVFEVFRNVYWTYQQLNGDVSALTAMPFQQNLPGPNGRGICITHASLQGIRDGIFLSTSDDDLRQKIEPTSALFCVGHTHLPLIRCIDHTLVVNVGAVGLPFDGDTRACYAQIEWQDGQWSVEIIRLEYDREKAEQDFFETGFMTDSGALARLILDEFRSAHANLYLWTELYQARVLAGEMTMEESAREYMANVNGNRWSE
jgi:predicted phosphodiesterase